MVVVVVVVVVVGVVEWVVARVACAVVVEACGRGLGLLMCSWSWSSLGGL